MISGSDNKGEVKETPLAEKAPKFSADQVDGENSPLPPNDFALEASGISAGKEKIPSEASEVDQKETTVFAFAEEFFRSKQAPSEQFRLSFSDLEPGFPLEAQNTLLQLALEVDPDLNRTLLLAEFLLETTSRREYRDQLIHFVQAVASNTGSLAKTPRNDHLQCWLDESRSAANVLERFVDKIERVRQLDSDKPLPLKRKNNLISIAAIWLFARDEIQIPQLIKVLRSKGMTLDGETGPHVTARAFAYVASMIRSTTKKRFAYFLDWTDRAREAVEAQLKHEQATTGELRHEVQVLREERAQLQSELSVGKSEVAALAKDLQHANSEKEKLSTELRHRDIHHGAEKSSNEADQTALLKDVLDEVKLAQTAMNKEKSHVVIHKLENIEEKLKAELL